MKNIIQIAGIIDQREADMLMNAGVDYLGFPLRLPVNIEDLSEGSAAEIIKTIKPPYHSVAITYLDNADEIIKFCHKLGVSIIQLHGSIEKIELEEIKAKRPGLQIIKSLVVTGENLSILEQAIENLSSVVDAFITDTFDPVTGASGATGKTHDWSISKRLVEISSKPVIIAGGLNPSNVRRAILEIHPAGVDVHTGVEGINGRKDLGLVKRFVEEAKLGFKIKV
ncbi:MAG: phosphoribosylanthranilate isomerase [bacterium]